MSYLNKGIKTSNELRGTFGISRLVLQIDLNKGIKTCVFHNVHLKTHLLVLQIDLNKGIKTLQTFGDFRLPFCVFYKLT